MEVLNCSPVRYAKNVLRESSDLRSRSSRDGSSRDGSGRSREQLHRSREQLYSSREQLYRSREDIDAVDGHLTYRVQYPTQELPAAPRLSPPGRNSDKTRVNDTSCDKTRVSDTSCDKTRVSDTASDRGRPGDVRRSAERPDRPVDLHVTSRDQNVTSRKGSKGLTGSRIPLSPGMLERSVKVI